MTSPLVVQKLEIRGFRNIDSLKLDLGPRINVIAGDNGQGKTSVLEALYFVATSRSFRTDKLRELCREGSDLTRVLAVFEEAGLTRRQRGAISAGRRNLFMDDKRATSMASYAVRTPVVIFHPGNLTLVSGPATLRRTLLDRIALFLDPASGDARARYKKAQRERHLVLQKQPDQGSVLDAFERVMATNGALLQRARQAASAALGAALVPAFERIASVETPLDLCFVPGGCTDPDEFAQRLRSLRSRDRFRKSAGFGPHKDELELSLAGRSARHHASQGQQRILTLALKVAELSCVRDASGSQPILLLDDVSSELDPKRTGAVYDFVGSTQSQVLVTTTRPELFQMPGVSRSDRCDFELSAGALKVPDGGY